MVFLKKEPNRENVRICRTFHVNYGLPQENLLSGNLQPLESVNELANWDDSSHSEKLTSKDMNELQGN